MEADFNNATLDDAIEMALFAAFIGKRHVVPARVASFDSVTQTIIAEPMISAESQDGKRVPLPPVADVPILQLGGDDFVLTFNPTVGDPCLLLVSDRCIDGWYETGENRIPADFRQNDLSDSLAIVGFRPKPMAIQNCMEGVTLRKVDGSYYINIDKAGNVNVKALKLNVIAENSEFSGNVKIGKTLYVTGGTTFIGDVNGSNAIARFKDAVIANITYSGHRHGGVQTGSGTSAGPQ